VYAFYLLLITSYTSKQENSAEFCDDMRKINL